MAPESSLPQFIGRKEVRKFQNTNQIKQKSLKFKSFVPDRGICLFQVTSRPKTPATLPEDSSSPNRSSFARHQLLILIESKTGHSVNFCGGVPPANTEARSNLWLLGQRKHSVSTALDDSVGKLSTAGSFTATRRTEKTYGAYA
jgi:hypothetical protein